MGLTPIVPPPLEREYLPGPDGELIDVTGYRRGVGRRREPVAPPLPRQWYPIDVVFTVALLSLVFTFLWLVLR